MRNLKQYPVTINEVVETLEKLCPNPQDNTVPIGGTQYMILRDIAEAAKSDPEWFNRTFNGKFGYEVNHA